MGLVAAVIAFTGCATGPSERMRPPAVDILGVQVDVPAGWSVVSAQDNPFSHGLYLTRDGPLLNRIHIHRLSPGDSFARAADENDAPRYPGDARRAQLADVLARSLMVMGYLDMRVMEDTAGARGPSRISFAGQWTNGLNVRAEALTVFDGSDVNVVLFIAPELHYYDAGRPAFDAIARRLEQEALQIAIQQN